MVYRRYNSQPVPVPPLTLCGNCKKSRHHKHSPRVFLQWLKMYVNKNYPIFLFVPHVRYIEEIGFFLKGLDHRIDDEHAKDPIRKVHVETLR